MSILAANLYRCKDSSRTCFWRTSHYNNLQSFAILSQSQQLDSPIKLYQSSKPSSPNREMTIFLVLSLFLVSFFSLDDLVSSPASPFEPGFRGEWHLLQESIGISAMHMQHLRDNKVVIFDRTEFGPSNLSLPHGHCRPDRQDYVLNSNCTAHSALYDLGTNTFRPLVVHTDTWCSSGSLLPNGTLLQIGGYNEGDRVIRTFTPCADDSCDWNEFPEYLSQRRWYATSQLLPEGHVITVGGRRQYNYEFYPKKINGRPSSSSDFWLQFLRDTSDESENNLYPFLHLLPDGNLFIFANTRSVLLDYNQNHVIKEYPRIPGGDPRNYPSSGSSVLLPLDENKGNNLEAEIMICGGSPRGSFVQALGGNFLGALSSCGRLKVSDDNPSWVMEDMPVRRVMGDMILLPTGDVIIINGAGLGTAGWENGRAPVLTPVIYRPSGAGAEWRFEVMSAASKPRLYHSTSILLIDGRVLVGGSNPHEYYNFTNVEFPTELSLEAFSPPYLAAEYALLRPSIVSISDSLGYKMSFSLTFKVPQFMSASVVSVRIVAPSFSTHSFNMNQRMVVLKWIGVTDGKNDTYLAQVIGPSTPQIAPPGYYMLFLVHAGIPSTGNWVKLQ